MVATRIIDSPRERLIAIITNNFSICNGRWPTLILMGTIFVGAAAPPALASLIAALSVVAIAAAGIVVTLLVSGFLSKTWLKGETSVYSLELPPYRPPQIMQTHLHVDDRPHLIVLWRAVVMAAPAGAVIWLTSNIFIGDTSIAGYLGQPAQSVGPAARAERDHPGRLHRRHPGQRDHHPDHPDADADAGREYRRARRPASCCELGDAQVYSVLTQVGGWTLLTAINLMLFSLLHNPCSTTILTIWNETKNLKWTVVATLLPLALAFLVTFSTATVARLLGLA